jgi:RHS repeat-associated protein
VGPANFLNDALGNTLALTNSGGANLAQYTYEPFGNTTIVGSSFSAYQYTGRENDGNGLYFLRGRYYNSTLQRFISEDPIGMAGGVNLYAYVDNNPISFRDPFGKDKGARRRPHFHRCFGGDVICDERGRVVRATGLSTDPIFDAAVTAAAGVGVSLARGALAAAAADAGETAVEEVAASSEASSPVGSQRSPWSNFDPDGPPINSADTVNGVDYSGHALDQMANRGIPPSVVDNALQTGESFPGNTAAETVHYDPVNNISVVTDTQSGMVVTVRYGGP